MAGSATRSGQVADEQTRQCSALTKKGRPCTSYALRDSDPPLCFIHSKSAEQLRQHVDDMRAAREANELHAALADAEAERRRLEAQARAEVHSDEASMYTSQLPEAFDHEADIERRLSELRDTLDAEREARALSAVLGEQAASHVVPDHTALRREWFDVRTRCTTRGELYVEELPAWMLGNEERAEVMRREAPSFDGYTVKDIASRTHVLAVAPDGREILVQRDAPRLMVGAGVRTA